MNELTLPKLNQMLSSDVDSLIENVLEFPQASCPVRHIFGAGIYIREVSIAAGVFSVGHFQKTKHMNHMLKGRVIMLNEDGTTSEVVAPVTFVSEPGRKIGLILEDMVWHNIYPTDETDIDTLEEMYLDKNEIGVANNKQQAGIEFIMNHDIREDFKAMLDELNVTAELVQVESENESDQIPLPDGDYKMKISNSYIQGKGVFVTAPVASGEIIAPARINGGRTPAGRYANHSPTPNAKMILRDNGDIDLVASENIDGCYGGGDGQEVTVDYRQVILEKGKAQCQA